MDIIIVYTDISKSFCTFEKYLKFISKERQEKILRFRFDKDKIISLFAELLIRQEVSKQLEIPYSGVSFGYSEYGKPYLLNDTSYHFSISHSGNCIAFVGGNSPIGIDVEQISNGNLKIAKRFFTINERDFIEKSVETNTAFYRILTSKEAYVKMLGLGLSKPFQSFDILNDLHDCRFVTKPLPEFMLTVCLENAQAAITGVTVVDPNQLLITGTL